MVIISQILSDQEEVEASVRREVMEAAAEGEETAGRVLIPLQEEEIQEVLAVLEEVAVLEEAVECMEVLEQEIVAVMAVREATAEEGEEEGLLVMRAALAVLAVVAVVAALD